MKKRVSACAVTLVIPLLLAAQSGGRFERLDRNRNGVIETGEWRGDSRAFDRLDTNYDDVITREEFDSRSGARTTNPGQFQRLDKNDSEAIEGYEWPYNREMFHQLDTDRNSVLTQDEFGKLTSSSQQHLDRNKDGALSSEEWPGGFAGFDQLDADRNGTVSAREYLNRGSEFEKERRFAQWDTNRSGAVEGTEWKSDNRLFHLLDRNQDSVLSLDEMMDRDRSAWLQGLDANSDNIISRNEWRGSTQSFQRLDLDADGRLEAGELNYGRSDWSRQNRFNALDRNRDGSIQRSEWQGNADRFYRLDRDGNGVLTAGEFFERGQRSTVTGD